MKMGKVAFVLAAFVVILAMGCGSGPGPGTESTSARDAARVDVRWDNDSGGFLTVENNTPEDLILFAGSINNRNILGGVRQLANRRIDFFSKVQSDSGNFLLRAVKESVYRSKGSQLDSDDVIFATLVVFNKTDARAVNVIIQRYVGGDAVVIMNNDTNMTMQIRVGRPDGDVLTTLAPLERNKRVYMAFEPLGYVFFPVYQFYDRATMGIRSIMAQSLFDGMPMMPRPPTPGQPIPVINWDANPQGLVAPFATLLIANESNRGCYLTRGGSYMSNQNGTQMINPGIETYELNLNGQPSLRIGGMGIDFVLGAANIMEIPAFQFEAATTYQISARPGNAVIIERVGAVDTSGSLRLELLNE